jgi:hypothetical protein
MIDVGILRTFKMTFLQVGTKKPGAPHDIAQLSSRKTFPIRRAFDAG